MKIMHTCTQRPWYVWLSLKKNSIFYQKSGLIFAAHCAYLALSM